jgi:hypothetical protein
MIANLISYERPSRPTDEYFETMDDADQELEISAESVQHHV